MKWFLLTSVLLGMLSCQNEAPSNTATTAEPMEDPRYATCTFQITQLQKLPNTPYKAVTAQRHCASTGQATHEVVLFASGEPMDNKKECNVFATTDTAARFQVQLGNKRIEILFNGQMPDSSSILMKQETVYDSIEIVYTVAPVAS